MYEIVPAPPSLQPAISDQAVVPYEQAIAVDSERLTLECPVKMDLLYDGKVVGYLRYMPRNVFWSARIQYDPRLSEEALGYGSTADEAIENAVTGGVRRLRDAANFAAKMGTQMRKHPKRVSLGNPEPFPSNPPRKNA